MDWHAPGLDKAPFQALAAADVERHAREVAMEKVARIAELAAAASAAAAVQIGE